MSSFLRSGIKVGKGVSLSEWLIALIYILITQFVNTIINIMLKNTIKML